ncbi:hypothetical protein [Lysobacter humi (ex Lee et al. 2017)]
MSRSMIIASALAAGLLAGCATTSEPHTAQVQPDGPVDPAQAYMQRVQAIAQRRGIGVIWVNPPTKKTLATQ